MKLSIIFVSYNTCELTINAIDSIYKLSKNNYEIIVVDNNSEDKTVDEVSKKFKDVIIIKNTENKGFGAANNIGFSVSKGEYLLFINTDTYLINDAVDKMVSYLDIHTDVSVVCGNLYSPDGSPAISFSRLYPGVLCEINTLLFNFLQKFKFFNYDHNYTKNEMYISGSPSGADFMIRKSAFEKCHGFDESFFLYYEETDMFFRLKNDGHKFVSLPYAKIVHLEGRSEDVKVKTFERSFKSKFIYLKKHKSVAEIKFVHAVFQLTCFIRIALFSILGNRKKIEYWSTMKEVERTAFMKYKLNLK